MSTVHSKRLAGLIVLLALACPAVSSPRPPGPPSLEQLHPSWGANQPEQEPGVKSITEWTYLAAPDGALGEGYRSAYVGFDPEARPLEQVTFDAAGSVLRRILNTYDEAGTLVESVSEDRSGDGSARTVFEYDGRHLTGTTALRQDGSTLVTTHAEYDEAWRMTSMVTEVPDASTSQTIVFEYNADGDAVATTTLDSARGLVSRAETSYTGDHWPAETTVTLPDGAIASATTYEYDPDGNVTEMVVSAADGRVMQSISNAYDGDGRVITSVTSSAAGVEYRVENAYDDHGNRSIAQTFNKIGQLVLETRYVYESYPAEED